MSLLNRPHSLEGAAWLVEEAVAARCPAVACVIKKLRRFAWPALSQRNRAGGQRTLKPFLSGYLLMAYS